jgi:pantothenate kinase
VVVQTRDIVVNGLRSRVRVDRELVHRVLLPALREVAARGSRERRQFVFLAAPPATGKSTLAAVLEHEAAELDLGTIGIDGFHHPNRYLESHTLGHGAEAVTLASIKGAPETYDVASLDRHLTEGAGTALDWPTYDRVTHDVVPASKHLDERLVLVEGNWLLLDEPGWRDLARHAAYRIFIDADPGLLHDRLVDRKVRGGLDRSEAEAFVARSDSRNVERVLQHTDRAHIDLMLRLNPDGTIERGELQ